MHEDATRRPWLGLAGWAAVTFVAAALGSMASVRSREFYGLLELPQWAPPGAVFGPVWTALYVLMAVAAWLVWRRAGWKGASTALSLFIVQLALNALWSWLFFAWRQGAGAFAEVRLLWMAIAARIAGFWRVRPLAGALMLPYLAWVTFASALTHAAWRMNPHLLGG